MKKLLRNLSLCLLASSLFVACSPPPEPEEPPYYFRFEADGEAFDYKYECEKGLFGGGCTFGAGATGSATHHHFNIYGSSWVDKAAQGRITFYLNETDVMELDTIMLDGVRNRVAISNLKFDGVIKSYQLRFPLTGKVILKERGADFIIGFFGFQAGNADGSIIDITSGEFYVPARFD